MRHFFFKILLIFSFLLSTLSVVVALPNCVGSWSKAGWHNCYASYTWGSHKNYPGTYVGEWKNGEMHGHGKRTWSKTGDIYIGYYQDGKRHGQGIYTWGPNSEWSGDKFIGTYKNDLKSGYGIHIWANGTKYFGEYKNGKINGEGIKYFLNGNISEGLWKDWKFVDYKKTTFSDSKLNAILMSEFKKLSLVERRNIQEFLYSREYYHGQLLGQWDDSLKLALRVKLGKFPQYDKNIWVSKELSKINYETVSPSVLKTVTNDTSKTKSCDDDPKLCAVAQLCTKASHYSGGKKAWRKDYRSKKYVTEAKKNGVSCGVQVVVKKEKPVDNKTYKVASGTGFYISNSGHIITNHHVIDGCKDMKVISQGRTIETLVLANDPLNDLALLKAKEDSKTYFSINNKQPEELQDVIVAGFPFGDKVSSSIKFTQGIVSSLTGIGDNYSQMQIDAALQPGNSGGPIMDNRGNVIGVAVAKLSLKKIMDDYGVVPENTNFGIKASAVRNLMVGNSIIVKDPSGDNITKSQLVKLAKEGTVHLTCWMTVAQIEKALKDETGKVLFKEFQK